MEICVENLRWAINHARIWTIDASGTALSFVMNTTNYQGKNVKASLYFLLHQTILFGFLIV